MKMHLLNIFTSNLFLSSILFTLNVISYAPFGCEKQCNHFLYTNNAKYFEQWIFQKNAFWVHFSQSTSHFNSLALFKTPEGIPALYMLPPNFEWNKIALFPSFKKTATEVELQVISLKIARHKVAVFVQSKVCRDIV